MSVTISVVPSSAPNIWPRPPCSPNSVLYRLISLHLCIVCIHIYITPHSSLWALWRPGLYLICSCLDMQHSEHLINVGRLLRDQKFHLQTEANENPLRYFGGRSQTIWVIFYWSRVHAKIEGFNNHRPLCNACWFGASCCSKSLPWTSPPNLLPVHQPYASLVRDKKAEAVHLENRAHMDRWNEERDMDADGLESGVLHAVYCGEVFTASCDPET